MKTSSQSCMMFDIALMCLNIPNAKNGKIQLNPLFPSSSDSDFPGLSSFVYDDDDGDDGSDGWGRLFLVNIAMVKLESVASILVCLKQRRRKKERKRRRSGVGLENDPFLSYEAKTVLFVALLSFFTNFGNSICFSFVVFFIRRSKFI